MNARPSWARRFRPVNERTCARPGCTAPAITTLQFLPTRREARLVALDPAGAPVPGDRCEHHATAVVLPRGWQLCDERPSAAVHPLAKRIEHVDTPPDVPASSRAARAGDAAHSDPELDRLLDADSPLLRRAFRNSRGA
ncbi:MAG TPA: DUF3499 family protein [Acidimicrobiia bacterium]|nr:DUF3499 family protein [Acidimicrobiia bacterium]